MRAASTSIAIGTALCFAASAAQALGFGQVSNATQLGQPLNFSAAVHLEGDDALPRECVAAEVVSGDNKLQPTQVRVSLEGSPEAADRRVRVTTSALIDEPVVTVSVTLGCTAKITRRFVAFIDPPLVNLAQAATPQMADTPSVQSAESPMAAIVAQAQRDSAPPTPRAAERASERATAPPRQRARAPVAARAQARSANEVKVAEAPAPRPAPPRAPAGARNATAPRTASGPRLQLEAAPAVVRRSASSPVATSAAAAVTVAAAASEAASAASAQADQVARERERFQALEDGLTRLRGESQATRQTLAALQARLKEAESERYANPLVYGLAWLSALLALAVAGLWWRQSRGRHATQWWAAPVVESAPAVSHPHVGPAPASAAMPLAQGPDSTRSAAFDISTVTDDDEAPARGAAAAGAAVAASGFAPTMPTPPVAEPARELSVEELIDLEQQAEFFIVLGQDEAAIELLMSHVRSDGGNSPLPYLKLLEIYRRRGENDAYERIRERFNRRFNAYAPDWESDLQHGHSLADYPDTMRRLQAMWSTPSRVMETLDASLFRRNRSDDTFDLPAYRELLFLYSIARDLAEHGGAVPTGSVDVLLPLGDASAEEPIARLVATTAPAPLQAEAGMTMPLDLDVSLSPTHELPHRDDMAAQRRSVEPSPEGSLSFVEFGLGEAVKPPKPGSSGAR